MKAGWGVGTRKCKCEEKRREEKSRGRQAKNVKNEKGKGSCKIAKVRSVCYQGMRAEFASAKKVCRRRNVTASTQLSNVYVLKKKGEEERD